MGKRRKGDGIIPIRKLLISQSYQNNKNKKLTKNERINLVIQAQNGDIKAKEELFCSLLGLVNSIALQYKNWKVPLEDLIQEGNLALLEAISTFDLKKGADFSTYAFYQIRKAIQQAICNYSSVVSAPYWLIQKSHKNQKNKHYPFPLPWVSEDEVIYDEGKYNDGEKRVNLVTEKGSKSEDEEIIEEIDKEKAIEKLNKKLRLDERKQIILERYLKGYNNAEIGRELGLSRERIRRIIKDIEEKIQF